MNWEYKSLTLRIADVPKAGFDDQLNQLGADGWELVCALHREQHGYSHEAHLLFKRAASRNDTPE